MIVERLRFFDSKTVGCSPLYTQFSAEGIADLKLTNRHRLSRGIRTEWRAPGKLSLWVLLFGLWVCSLSERMASSSAQVAGSPVLWILDSRRTAVELPVVEWTGYYAHMAMSRVSRVLASFFNHGMRRHTHWQDPLSGIWELARCLKRKPMSLKNGP